MGPLVQIDLAGWDRRLPAFELAIPGDLSAAALLFVAAQLVAGSRVTIRGVGINPTRTGLLEIARDMGAGLAVEPQGERGGEPVAPPARLERPAAAPSPSGARPSRARSTSSPRRARWPRARRGTTRIPDAEEWGDGDRSDGRRPAGVRRRRAKRSADGLEIEGREEPLEGADDRQPGRRRDRHGGRRRSRSPAATPSRVRDAACIARIFPKFVATLRALGARIDVE